MAPGDRGDSRFQRIRPLERAREKWKRKGIPILVSQERTMGPGPRHRQKNGLPDAIRKIPGGSGAVGLSTHVGNPGSETRRGSSARRGRRSYGTDQLGENL